MLILPALGGIAHLIHLLFEGAALGALFGGLFGGAIGGGGEIVTCLQEHGEIHQECIEKAAESAGEEAVEGALLGGVTGGAFAFAGPVLQPLFAMIDDFFRGIFGALDDAAQRVTGAIDDAITGARRVADDIISGIRAFFNRTRNTWNAQNYKTLPKTNSAGNKGYVYVMDDVANPGRYKIGRTTDPTQRLRGVKSRTKLELDYSCIIRTDDMGSLEDSLFKQFAQQRRPNAVDGTTEIFMLTAAQVATACAR